MKRNKLEQEEVGASRRIAELEAENTALREQLARVRLEADQVWDWHDRGLAEERARRAADAAEARSTALAANNRHERVAPASRADLVTSEGANEALRRANADLVTSRAALREREERLRLILASATDYAIFATDLKRRVTSWNTGAERLLGWSEPEIVGRPADVIFTPEDRAQGAPQREAEGAVRDGRAADERWHRRKDGTRFWANGLMLPLRDPEADPAEPPDGLLKIMRDETVRRRAEEALREAEDHLRHTVELNPQIPWTADPEGRITGFSERWLKATGLSREAAMGEGWMDVPHPEDRPRMVVAWTRASSTGEPYDVEARLRMADGAFRWWRARAFPRRDGEGRVVRWYGTTEDIHGRKTAEEALRAGEARWRVLFERMAEGFALCEIVYSGGKAVDYRHLEVNAAWERLTGMSAAATIGRPASEIMPGLESFWAETFARVVETGEPALVERFAAPLGRWYEVMAYRTEPGRFAAMFLDVTGRKAAEARSAALVELGDRLRDLRDHGEIARTAAEVIGRALGATRAGYGAVEDEETLRVERDWTGGPEVGSVAGEWRLSDFWTGFADDLRRGEAVVLRDVSLDPRAAASADAYAAIGARALVVVPVVAAGRVAAMIFVHDAAPRAWTSEEVAFARGAAERAWAAAERARAEQRRALLVNELNHRVKNTLAVVQSIAAQTARGVADLPAFSEAFQARLIALARAHDLLTRTEWEGAPLHAVARAALEPLAAGSARVDLSGCASGAMLPPATALALAMALHELATNALKHGALSVPGGRVTISSGINPGDGAPVVEWIERDGPRILAPPVRRGFGLRLLAAQAGVVADLRFEPKGVHCTLRLSTTH